MTDADAPEPPEEEHQEGHATYSDLERPNKLLSAALSAWTNDMIAQAAVKQISESGRLLREIRKARNEKASIEERSAAALEVATGAAHDLGERADASDRRAKLSFRVAVASTVIAALALIGALPQGIAAIPQMVAVFNGSAWEKPPAVMVPALPSEEPAASSPSPPPPAEATE